MKIISNQKLIKRNKKISQFTLYASLVLLAIGLILSFTETSPDEIGWTYLILIPGYLLVQASIYFGNKWGKSPRPDEIISTSLKGLDDKHSLYHYVAGVPHLLIGPPGMWIIKPYHQSGSITYDEKKGKYKQKGGGNIISKLFGQESLGDILHDSKLQKRDLFKYFDKHNIQLSVQPSTVNVFSSDKVAIEVGESPEVVIPISKLKGFLRRISKSTGLNDSLIQIKEKLPQDDIN